MGKWADQYLSELEALRIKTAQREKELRRLQKTAGLFQNKRLAEKELLQLEQLEEKVLKCKTTFAVEEEKRISQIQELDNPKYVDILYLRYVENMPLNQIAGEMCYAYDYTRKLLGHAQRAFETKHREVGTKCPKSA